MTGLSLEYVFKKATGETLDELGNMGVLSYAGSYANGDDAGKGILMANWNHFPDLRAGNWGSPDREAAQQYNWSKKGRRFSDILERMGYHLEWEDEAIICDECYGVITKGPDFYGDTAHYATLGNDEVCAHCIRTRCLDEYLTALTNNPKRACNIWGIDPTQHGYKLISDDFEAGLHGQHDQPEEIYKRLKAEGKGDLLFCITDSGQFAIHFAVYEKTTEEPTNEPEPDPQD
jgi:hypothetical protein